MRRTIAEVRERLDIADGIMDEGSIGPSAQNSGLSTMAKLVSGPGLAWRMHDPAFGRRRVSRCRRRKGRSGGRYSVSACTSPAESSTTRGSFAGLGRSPDRLPGQVKL